jgi:hypothetical protein
MDVRRRSPVRYLTLVLSLSQASDNFTTYFLTISKHLQVMQSSFKVQCPNV